jgi:putative addiction module killer protein
VVTLLWALTLVAKGIANTRTIVHNQSVLIRQRKRKAIEYKADSGKKPFSEWLLRLKDRKGRAVILRRINQAEEGNFGNHRDLHDGLFELKVPFGPGYRVYFGIDGDSLIVLLCGGDKGSQDRDIELARKFWADYQEGN